MRDFVFMIWVNIICTVLETIYTTYGEHVYFDCLTDIEFEVWIEGYIFEKYFTIKKLWPSGFRK